MHDLLCVIVGLGFWDGEPGEKNEVADLGDVYARGVGFVPVVVTADSPTSVPTNLSLAGEMQGNHCGRRERGAGPY